MSQAVIKGAAYVLIHGPDMLVGHGTTQTMERAKNPESDYLKNLPNRLRGFPEVVAYPPNQAYIGGIHPAQLGDWDKPLYRHPVPGADRYAKYGEIMPQDEFYGLMKICDAFELVLLEEAFAMEVKGKLARHPLLSRLSFEKLKGNSREEIERIITGQHAEALMAGESLVGCVRRAHETDPALKAGIIYENLAAKASGVLALLHLLKVTGLDPKEVDYILECSEEACGDMNQRGGGNFAKAIGEVAGCLGATGSDTRGFCAAPVHALIEAAALVQAGVFRNVMVVAGGATAKLGMNGKDHHAKGLPILEDVLGGFGVLVSQNDGVNPIIRTDVIGRHTIGAGGSPQAVMQAIVTDPLDRAGLKIGDVDLYAVEMQNPEITVPAGAGDVPLANYKMIAALGVKRQEMEREAINHFPAGHGLPGFAPTQGHIPSGVPVIGPARDMILEGQIKRAMIIGKGSLFLARMTSLFDGVSFLMEANPGQGAAEPAGGEAALRQLLAGALRQVAQSIEEEGGRWPHGRT
ncbi:MAG: glycine/sarcosine/betaine reductase complex component C subunit beta [Bacillota bacterium]